MKNLTIHKRKMSHPAWVCGLKHTPHLLLPITLVTPCVGVWIETDQMAAQFGIKAVTPCVGVWIETLVLELP